MNDLDTRIRAAAPDIPDVPGLADHRARILQEARGRRGRRLRIWAASTVASILLIGGGSMAVAGTGNETPWGWIADNVFSIGRPDGSACFQGIRVMWEGLAADDPIVLDARAIVADIDLEALDTTAVEAQILADHVAAMNDPNEPAPREMSPDEVKQSAISSIVAERLFAGLLERGHEMWPGHEVRLSSDTTECR
jgi:hypothetical protein